MNPHAVLIYGPVPRRQAGVGDEAPPDACEGRDVAPHRGELRKQGRRQAPPLTSRTCVWTGAWSLACTEVSGLPNYLALHPTTCPSYHTCMYLPSCPFHIHPQPLLVTVSWDGSVVAWAPEGCGGQWANSAQGRSIRRHHSRGDRMDDW